MTRETSQPPKRSPARHAKRAAASRRIVGIWPHKRFKRRQRWSVACTVCGAQRDVEMLGPRRPHSESGEQHRRERESGGDRLDQQDARADR